MSALPSPARPRLAGLVLAGAVLVSGLTFLGVRQMVVARARHRFDMAADEARDRLVLEVRQGIDLVRGLRSLAQTNGGMDRDRLRAFLQSMGGQVRYPGLQGISYAVPVAAPDRARLLERVRAGYGRPGLQVNPGWGYPDDALVVYAETLGSDVQSLGYNPASRPETRQSLVAARDSGLPQASPPIRLIRAPGAGPGLLLRLAVYQGLEVPDVLARRQAAYAGCVTAVYLAEDLVRETFRAVGLDGLRVRLVDVQDGPVVIEAGGGDLPAGFWHALAPRGFAGRRPLEFGNRAWNLQFTAGPGFFMPMEAALPWLSAAVCLMVGALLAGLLHSLARTGARAQELARRMTRQLRASQARLQAIVRVVPDVLLVYDRDGRYLEILTQDQSRLWAPPERMLGRRVAEVLPGTHAELVQGAIGRALGERREVSVDYSLATLSGQRRFEARAIPLEAGFGDQPAVLWAARDITEREGQEAALRQAQKLESVGLLAGGIAHDFNNLLTAIQGHLCLGRRALAEGREPDHHLDRVEATVALAADLARQLLSYSGHTPTEMQSLDINALVRDLGALLGVSHSRQARLDLDLAGDLPPVRGDRVQVQQVILNLITNASEAIGDRPGCIRLATRSGRLDAAGLAQRLPAQDLEPGPYVTLTVADDGCGMEPEVLARIFDPFFTTKRSGRGLGLSALRGILRTHHAGLEVASRAGQGTTVTLHFPALAAPAPQPADPGPDRPRCLGAGTLLLAEDEPTIRELTTQMLELLGFQVLAGEDGETAWALYQAHRGEIRAAILDLTMPGRSGAEVYALIRARDAGLPILLCSGYSREALPEPSGPAEPRGFLEKPFTFARLESALQDLLASSTA